MNEKGLGGKFWTHVYFDNGTLWIPAVWEQAMLAQMAVICERIKYPDLGWDAGAMPTEFITRAMEGQNIDALCHDRDARGREFGLYKSSSYARLSKVLKNSRKETTDLKPLIWTKEIA